MTKLEAAKMLLRHKAEMLKQIDEDLQSIDEDLQSIIEKKEYEKYDKEFIYELVDYCLEGTSRLENIIDAAEWTYNSGIGDQVSRIRSRVEIIEGYLEWARRNKK